MKKNLVVFILMSLLQALVFAFPNTSIYFDEEYYEIIGDTFFIQDGTESEPIGYILNDKLYSSANKYLGTLYQLEEINKNTGKKDYFIFDYMFEDIPILRFQYVIKYSFSNPYPLSIEKYKNDLLEEKTEYLPNTPYPITETYYYNGELFSKDIYEYDPSTGFETKKIEYSVNDDGDLCIDAIYESDGETGNLKKLSEFENGELKITKFYDLETQEVEKAIKHENGIITEFSFLKFTDNVYRIDDSYYMQKNICDFYRLEEFAGISQYDYIDWNEDFYVLVTKYDIGVTNSIYKYLRAIRDKKIYFDDSVKSVAFLNDLFDEAFIFIIADNQLIQESCYKIEFIKKPEF
ncbi:MAG: hypothetical protein MJ188_03780 [Treponema sp.]|nr:hypothetical protein [Treponema sp.]